MDSMLIIPPIFGIAGLLVALFLYLVVLRYDGGTDKVMKIADQIHLRSNGIYAKRVFVPFSFCFCFDCPFLFSIRA